MRHGPVIPLTTSSHPPNNMTAEEKETYLVLKGWRKVESGFQPPDSRQTLSSHPRAGRHIFVYTVDEAFDWDTEEIIPARIVRMRPF